MALRFFQVGDEVIERVGTAEARATIAEADEALRMVRTSTGNWYDAGHGGRIPREGPYRAIRLPGSPKKKGGIH